MARFSGVGAPATPERTSEETENESNGEEGSYNSSGRKSDNSRPTTRHSASDNIDGTMGQGESREMLQERNATIRAASKMAVQPQRKKPGSLPSYSGRKYPQTVSGQRRLRPNPMGRPEDYDLAEDERPSRKRQTISSHLFSPLKRHQRQSSRSLEEANREDQWLVDAQLGQFHPLAEEEPDFVEGDNQVEEAEAHSRRKSRKSRKSRESAQAAEEDDSHVKKHEANKALEGSSRAPEPAADAEGSLEYARNDHEQDTTLYDRRHVVEPQQSNVIKKRGRPAKTGMRGKPSVLPATDSPQDAPVEKRRAGRPSKTTAEQMRSVEVTQSVPSHNASPEDETRRKSTRVLQQKSRTIESEAAAPPSKRQRRSSAPSPKAARPTVGPKSAVRSGEPQIAADAAMKIHDAEWKDAQPQSPGSVAQNEDEGDNGSTDCSDEEAEDNPQEEEADINEDVEQPLDEADHHRLYGHWSKLREIIHFANEHGRSNAHRIKNDDFKAVLQECREVTGLIKAAAPDTSTDELEDLINRSRSILSETQKICGNSGSHVDFTDKRRGFRIFKLLFPSLAQLLFVVVQAYERLDIEAGGKEQLTLEHLHMPLEIMAVIKDSEKSAYDGFLQLSRPIKRQIHNGIAIPVREIYASLRRLQTSRLAEQQARAEKERIASEHAAFIEEQERRARSKTLSDANRNHWNHLNLFRIGVANTFSAQKLRHLRSCPATLVKTDAGGRPNLSKPANEESWTMPELNALKEGLQKYADHQHVPPSESKVFQRLINRECRPGGHLTARNVLEIVNAANQLKDYLQDLRLERGEVIEPWVERIPRWIWPEAGDTAQDAVEM
ncbi:hypothetical protein Q7P37_000391 [Cladosporium fusiforme]